MSQREHFTWIGPVSEASSAGAVARGFVAGLARIGAIASVLDTGDGSVECASDLDGAVRPRGSTVVRHAPLSRVAVTAAIVPLDGTARQVAYVVVDCAVPPVAALEVLGRCDEVWAPSTLQAELLCSLGVERERVLVVAPGADCVRTRPVRAGSSGSAWCDTARALVIGNPAVAEVLEGARRSGPHFERALAPVGTQASTREIERADLVVILDDVDPWGRVVLETLALGTPLAHVESGTALEYAGPDDCAWFDAATASDPTILARCLSGAFSNRAETELRATRARAGIETRESIEAAARALLVRATRPRVLPEARLARVLTELGLPTASERLSGSRARVVIVPVRAAEGSWRRALREQLAAVAAEADTTVCLWVDERLAARAADIAALAEVEIGEARAGDVDVLVVVAPLAHAPRESVVTCAA